MPNGKYKVFAETIQYSIMMEGIWMRACFVTNIFKHLSSHFGLSQREKLYKSVYMLIDQSKGLLDEQSTAFVRELADHNEGQIAIETICDLLYDNDVQIKRDYYDEIYRLAGIFRVEQNRIDPLSKLVIDTDDIS